MVADDGNSGHKIISRISYSAMGTKPSSITKLELQDIAFSEQLHKLFMKQRAIARVLLHCHPSAFFDLDDVPNRHKEACLRGKLTMAAIHKNKSGRLVLAVIPRKGQYTESIREMLQKRNVRVVVGNLPDDYESIRHECEEAIERGLILSDLRVISDGENWIARRAREATQFEEYDCLVFHEMAIDSVISSPVSQRESSAKRALSDEEVKLERFYRTSSFDVIITTSSPRVRPLLAIEFDGPVHDKPGKRAKDQMKNDLCIRAGMPLIRVRYSDVPMRSWDEVEKLSNARIRDQYDEKIRFLVRRLAANGLLDLFRDEQRLEHFRMMLKHYVSLETKHKKLLGIVKLSMKQQEEVWQQVWEEFGGEDPELVFQEWDERNAADEAEFESYIRQHINATGATISEISYYDNKAKGGIVASADIQLPGEPSRKLTSPPVQLNAVGVSPNMLSKLSKEFAREWIVHRALTIEKAFK